jgi:Dullard-like phosphatase family protein
MLQQTRRVFSTTQRAVLPRLRIVLDMDECMIHAAEFGDGQDRRHFEQRKAVEHKVHGLHTEIIDCEDGCPVLIHHRPGLADCLKRLAEFADVYAFTAALPVYARPVLKSLDPNNIIFNNIWYRNSCTQIKIGNQICYTKDIKVLGEKFDSERTILVDNNIISHILSPANGILVSSFYDNASDRELDDVLEMAKLLDKERDVKPLLHDVFDLTSQVREMTVNINNA